MLELNATTQQKIMDIVNTLPDDADISAPMFYHVVGDHKSVVNKSLRKLTLKGLLMFDRTEANPRGGQPMNIYKKVTAPKEDTFKFGLITEGVFADLFAKPYPCEHAEQVRLLTGDINDDSDD